MPRRSANLICLPNLAALGATSQEIPRARSASAILLDCERVSSLVTSLVGRGIAVTALIPRRPTLEEYFRERLRVPEAAA